MRLKLQARADLDGTHEAVVRTNLPRISEQLEGNGNDVVFLKIQASNEFCFCKLRSIEFSKENAIQIDSFKLHALKVRPGQEVVVDRTVLRPATRVLIRVPRSVAYSELNMLRGRPLRRGEVTALYTSLTGKPRPIAVVDTGPEEVVHVTNQTVIDREVGDVQSGPALTAMGVRFSDIGGLDREIRILRETLEWPLRHPDTFDQLGIPVPSGVLLYGPPGTGKTMLIRALSNEVGAWFTSISGPEIFDKFYGETERKLREVFDQARQHVPAIVLIDELDALVPKRDASRGELEQRVVASFLTLMDGMQKQPGVVVVGTTNRPNAIDPALRREGRFGLEIYVGVPDSRGREQILKLHARRMPLAEDVDYARLASLTSGYVGADLQALCRAAAYAALRKKSVKAEALPALDAAELSSLRISQTDFESSLTTIRPSAMKEFQVEVPHVAWEEICGLEDIKRILIENVVYPIQRRAAFEKVGLKPARGVLLFGPPGTGKTLLARAVATECGVNFISIKGPEVRSKWLGESEERVRQIFATAREVAPSVIFFDEIDAVAPARGQEATSNVDSIVNQLLTEMDGIESSEGVFVIGATNRQLSLDPALLRSGRFDYQVEVPLPDAAARGAIFRMNLRAGFEPSSEELNRLAEEAEGLSGADIAEICRQAKLDALRGSSFDAEKVRVRFQDILAAAARLRDARGKLEPRRIGFRA